jgi:large subunit ribosomal protein L2
MAIKRFRPKTPTLRYRTLVDNSDLSPEKPQRSLLKPLKSKAGRNNHGHISMRRRGGGHKRKYRIVDFKRDKAGIPAKVAAIEYDPNRSARIALLHYVDGEKRYIIAPDFLKVGDRVVTDDAADIKPGNTITVGRVPLGTIVHNVEMVPGKGAQLARSAGTGCQVVAREGDFVQIKLPSGEVRMFRRECKCTVGQVGNIDHMNITWGKAGRTRWAGRRPKVRGVAMNPVDHPLGGGEGKSSGGRHPVSPWGMPTKGFKTRKRKPSDRLIVKKRSKK